MEQILVVKSSKKDVLVKNLGGGATLYQTPGKTPSFKDLARAGFKGKGTSGNPVGVGGRIAGLAGMAGKGLAALQTVNQVAHQAQAGNPLGAALSAGYTYQANDPTGELTGQAIQGQAPPTPSVEEQRANVPQIPIPGSVQDTQSPSDDFGGMPSSSYVAPQAPQAPVAVKTTGAAAARAKFNREVPTPSLVPQPVQPQQTTPAPQYNITNPYQNQIPQVNSAVQNLISGGMTGQGPVNPNNQQAMISAAKNLGTQIGTEMAQQQPADGTLNPYFDMNVLDEHTNKSNANLFASTLMEKLGADTVYKMSPHQIAALSAYTFLKLS